MITGRDEPNRLSSSYLENSGLHFNANSNTNSSSNGSSNANPDNTKKKRKKIIKSCTFCRRRKVRCDQQKPMCSTCVGRGFSECTYMENDFLHPVVGRKQDNIDSNESVINTRLLLKVNELEKQLKDVASKVGSNGDGPPGDGKGQGISGDAPEQSSLLPFSTTSPANTDVNICPGSQRKSQYTCIEGASSASVNPFRRLYILQTKRNGRKILYGPTSLRTFNYNKHWGLMARFGQLKEKLKSARVQIKHEWNYSALGENKLIEAPLDPLVTNHADTSIARQLVLGLPSYEAIQRALELFFAKPDLYEISEAFDKKKVFADFRMGFVPGSPSLANGERSIINVIPFTKCHYYKIGVIVGIFCLVDVGRMVPEVIQKFFVFLSGLSTAKTTYVERVQFTLLRYFHRNLQGLNGGDDSHEIILVNSLVCDSIILGLNHNIKVLFSGQDELLGSTDSLEKLWCWVVYLDFSLAFQIGTPLKITEENIFHEEFFDDNTRGYYGLTKRFLKEVARPIMRSIFNKSEFPDLNRHFDDLIRFTEKEFLPISFYTNKELIHKTPLRGTRILSSIFSMLLCLRGLQFSDGSNVDVHTKNSAVKVALIAFATAKNAIARNSELDNIHLSELRGSNNDIPFPHSPVPYLIQSIWIFFTLFVRAIPIPYVLAYVKLTSFDDTVFLVESHDQDRGWDLNTFEAPKSETICVGAVLSSFFRIFDELREIYKEQAKKVQQGFHGLPFILTVEKVQRMVLQEVLEIRTAAEKTWKSQLHQGIPSSAGRTLTPSSMSNVENADSNMFGNSYEQLSSATSGTSIQSPLGGAVAAEIAVNGNPKFQANTHAPYAFPSVDKAHPNMQGVTHPDVGLYGQGQDVIGMIAGEFWENYNSRWTELLNNVESVDLFSDADL